MKQHLIEVHTHIKSMAKSQPKEYANLKKFHITVPTLRSIIKQKTFSFQQLEIEKQLEIWNYIWHKSDYFESMSMAIYPFQHKTLKKNELDTLLNWVDKCYCWEHSDDLSKIFAQVLEENPKWILPVYKEWNQSDNLWKRRQSIVGLLEYSSKRKKVLSFKELIVFIKPLLNDSEYYVQKGIGWTLREIYNVYPKETIEFIDNQLLHISSIAYSAATEKLGKQIKQDFNLRRKINRTTK